MAALAYGVIAEDCASVEESSREPSEIADIGREVCAKRKFFWYAQGESNPCYRRERAVS